MREGAKRVKVKSVILVGFLGSGHRFTGDLVDLSASGALVRCSENLDPGTLGRLGIPVGHDMIRVVARVERRVSRLGLAFKFTGMTFHNRSLLHRLLRQLEG